MIKVTFGEEPKQDEKPFPKTMNYGDLVVLFECKGAGVVLRDPSGPHVIGYYYKGFIMKDFTDYNGPVTIQNA